MKNLLMACLLLLGATLAVPFGAAQTSQPTVAGKWHFVFDTEGGDRAFDPVFEQSGDQVTGKWGNGDVKGTFADGKLVLSFPLLSEEAGQGTLKVNGTLGADDTLTGDWAFNEYAGKFKATRTKP